MAVVEHLTIGRTQSRIPLQQLANFKESARQAPHISKLNILWVLAPSRVAVVERRQIGHLKVVRPGFESRCLQTEKEWCTGPYFNKMSDHEVFETSNSVSGSELEWSSQTVKSNCFRISSGVNCINKVLTDNFLARKKSQCLNSNPWHKDGKRELDHFAAPSLTQFFIQYGPFTASFWILFFLFLGILLAWNW